jgi:phosphoribosylformimino-5-aminoimidazole carboxamide ribotide isomerase
VDLNGAFAGKPVNEAAIKAIVKEVGDEIPVQLGGGIRDLDTIERYLDDGLSFIIIGTAAVKNPGFLRDACSGLRRSHHRRASTPRTARSPPTAGAR